MRDRNYYVIRTCCGRPEQVGRYTSHAAAEHAASRPEEFGCYARDRATYREAVRALAALLSLDLAEAAARLREVLPLDGDGR